MVGDFTCIWCMDSVVLTFLTLVHEAYCDLAAPLRILAQPQLHSYAIYLWRQVTSHRSPVIAHQMVHLNALFVRNIFHKRNRGRDCMIIANTHMTTFLSRGELGIPGDSRNSFGSKGYMNLREVRTTARFRFQELQDATGRSTAFINLR